MQTQAENVYDVRDADFQQLVVEESKIRPVVVDFWSTMCGPCRVIGPILERIVESYGGKIALAKVNVAENQQVAAALGIQGVPAIKIIKDGGIATEFVGALPEDQVRKIIEGVVPSEADEAAARGAELARDGNIDQAEAEYRSALELTPGHASATMGLAYIAVERGDTEQARQLAESIEYGIPEKELAEALLAQLAFSSECNATGDLSELEANVEASPDNLDARFSLAQCLAARGEYERALQLLLEIVQRDKTWNDGAAKQTMVKIFGIVGKRSELADSYRQKLAAALY